MKPRIPNAPQVLRRQIPSRLREVDAVCLDIRAFLVARGLVARSFNLELVARECLNNAILHGNRSASGKNVAFELVLGRLWIRLRITDQGTGFNWRKARKKPVPDAKSTSGRGLPISMMYADRVRFNRCGNRIDLWFFKNRAEHRSL
jgi:serine/threonine-protein kinase RsbW